MRASQQRIIHSQWTRTPSMKLALSSFSFVELGTSSAPWIAKEDQSVHSLCAVVTTTHGQEQDIHIQALCERESDGDRSALACEVRSPLVHGLRHTLRQ